MHDCTTRWLCEWSYMSPVSYLIEVLYLQQIIMSMQGVDEYLEAISRIKEYSSFTFKTLYLISYFIFSKTVTTRGILKNWIKINDEKKDDKLLVLILIFKTRQTERSEKILGKVKSKPWCWYICYCCYNNMDYKLLK